MKLLKSVLLFSLVLLLFSCSSEDSTPIDINAQEEDLVGTWNLIEESQDGIVKIKDVPVNGTISSTGKDIDAQIVFTTNPNNYSSTGGYTDVIDISMVGLTFDQEEIPISIGDLIPKGSWSINKGVLTLTQNNIDQTVNITELTTSRLKIEFDIEQDLVYQGTALTVDSTIKMTLIKQ